MSSIGLALFALPVMSGCDPVPPSPKSPGMLPPGLSSPPPTLQAPSLPKASVVMPLPSTAMPSVASASSMLKDPSPLTPLPTAIKEKEEMNKLSPPPGLLPPGDKLPQQQPGIAAIESVENEGYTIHLASSILTAGTNPFLDRLPHPLVAVPAPAPGSSSVFAPLNLPPPSDPFQSLHVVGILYNPKKPIALISMSGSSNKMVRVGTVLSLPEGSLRVTRIQRDLVELQRVDDKKQERRKFALPSILDFTSSIAPGEKTAPVTKSSTSSELPVPSNLSTTPGLNNFTRLMEDGALVPSPETTTMSPSGKAPLFTRPVPASSSVGPTVQTP